MSRIIIMLAVDDVAGADPLGAKEAVAMALEPLGQVRVLRVDISEPEQMRIGGTHYVERPMSRMRR